MCVDVDGSTAIGTVVHTMSIRDLNPTTTTSVVTSTGSGISSTPLPPPVPRIELSTDWSPFELHSVNNSKYFNYTCMQLLRTFVPACACVLELFDKLCMHIEVDKV